MNQNFYDVAFKKVFNNRPELTMKFLNAILRLEGGRAIKSVEPISDISESEKSILDLKFTNQSGYTYNIHVINTADLTDPIQGAKRHLAKQYYPKQSSDGYPQLLLSIIDSFIETGSDEYSTFWVVKYETEINIVSEKTPPDSDDMCDRYALVELPKFTKTLAELKTPEDYWIYLLKESHFMHEVPEQAPAEIKEALTILRSVPLA